MARKPGSRSRDYDLEPATNKLGPKAMNPHSQWQLLVEKQRETTKQPIRKIAELSQIPAGTLFNWVRSKRGAPPRASYTDDLNRNLARALRISPEELAEAYNASAFRPLKPDVVEAIERFDGRHPKILSQIAEDGLVRLIAILRASGRLSFSIEELEVLIQVCSGPKQDRND